MAKTDSVSLFAEGTFEEQTQEIVEYIAHSRPEEERSAFKQPFADAFKQADGQKPIGEDEGRRQQVISQVIDALDGLGEGSDREIEGFFNLVFSHLVSVYPEDSPELSKSISRIVDIISQGSAAEHTSVKYRVLANLFNAISRTSSDRLVVCKALLKLASENDELDSLRLTTADVDRWLNEWSATPEEKSKFLKDIADAFSAAGQLETAFTFSISHVRSLPSASAEPAGLQLIASALRISTIFDFDSILKLESIQSLSSNELYNLLIIFNKQGLGEFNAWKEKNQSILDEYQLDSIQLERKMRLLILSELGFSKIGQNLSYGEIASALQIEKYDVEKWAIDVIRAGLLSGKLSQTTQTLHVVRASPRGFSADQWTALEQRLLAWKEGLTGIQNVLSATRQSMGSTTTEQVAA